MLAGEAAEVEPIAGAACTEGSKMNVPPAPTLKFVLLAMHWLEVTIRVPAVTCVPLLKVSLPARTSVPGPTNERLPALASAR